MLNVTAYEKKINSAQFRRLVFFKTQTFGTATGLIKCKTTPRYDNSPSDGFPRSRFVQEANLGSTKLGQFDGASVADLLPRDEFFIQRKERSYSSKSWASFTVRNEHMTVKAYSRGGHKKNKTNIVFIGIAITKRSLISAPTCARGL
jgi:hypothetical protein